MAQKNKDHSNRPVETIQPLAHKLGVNVNAPETRDHPKDLVDDIMSQVQSRQTVLICWEHHWLVPVANFFGIPVKNWSDSPFNASSNDDTDFYSVWVITPTETGLDFAVYDEPQNPAAWNGVDDLQARLTKSFTWDEADDTFRAARDTDWKQVIGK
eukprot:jgi/Botrbrau1/15381/Bobra.43_2s0011.2